MDIETSDRGAMTEPWPDEAPAVLPLTVVSNEPTGPHCGTCRHYHHKPVSDRETTGECWRYPPDPVVVNERQLLHRYRRCHELRVCGEYEFEGLTRVERAPTV